MLKTEEELESMTPAGDGRDDFARLANEWKTGRNTLSTAKRMADHPAYQAIIRMGWPAVPLIVEELRQAPDHWFIALHEITGAAPVPETSRGNLAGMAAAWIDWWREIGHAE